MAGEVTIRSASRPVQKAVKSRLSSALGVTASVYDFVPQNTAYPYVVIGDDTERAWKSKGTGGVEVTVTVHSYSQFRGREQVKNIMDTIAQDLTGTVLDLSSDNFAALAPELEFAEVLTEFSDRGETYHGIQRFRYLIQDTT